jgi:hypothetical protein
VGNKITVLWDVMPCRSVERLHVSNKPLTFSSVLLSHLTTYRCVQLTQSFVVAVVIAIIKFNVIVILNYCTSIGQETAIRGK